MKLVYRFLVAIVMLTAILILVSQHRLLKTKRRLTPRLFLQDIQDADDTFKSGNVIKSIVEINGRNAGEVRGRPVADRDRFSDIDHEVSVGFTDSPVGPMKKTLNSIQERMTDKIDKFQNKVKMADTFQKDMITRFSGEADFTGIAKSKMINTKPTNSVVHLVHTGGAGDRNSDELKTMHKATSSGLQTLSNNKIRCWVIDDRTTKTNISIPFKIYVYDMPSMFTTNASDCIKASSHADCMDLGSCGFGTKLDRDDIMSIHNSHQFSLEILIHHKMLTSPYRTLNPATADIFYAPIYGGAMCNCFRNTTKKLQIVDDFFKFLQKSEYFIAGRPHLSALPRIQRENAHHTWPILAHRSSHKILYLTIEKEISSDSGLRDHNPKVKVIPVPYPSYAHYHPDGLVKDGQKFRLLRTQFLEKERNVFLFWAAGGRVSNWLRENKIMPQFNSTKLNYEQYMTELKAKHQSKEMVNSRSNATSVSSEIPVRTLWLLTPECQRYHRYSTIKWMQHSTFCLQPPGDSPTRKSIYDSILAGCIPVLFDHKNGKVPYPYSTKLNYAEFTVSLSLTEQAKMNYFEILKSRYSEADIERLQKRLVQVAPLFQYSFPLNNGEQKDAMVPIMDEVMEFFKL